MPSSGGDWNESRRVSWVSATGVLAVGFVAVVAVACVVGVPGAVVA